MNREWILVGLAVLLGGCGMNHDAMNDPSSVPIPAITYDALFVVNGGSNSLSVINAATNEVAGTITLKNLSYPHHVYASGDRSALALAVPGMDLSAGHESSGHPGHGTMGALLRLDALTGETKVARQLDGPNHNAIFSLDGKEIWTSQMTMAGKVLVLDPGTLATRQTIDVGDMPAEVTFSRDGKYAFVANGMSNSVTVIDAATKAVVKTISVGANPVGAWPGADGVMYVDNETGMSLTAINATTLEIARTYNLGFMPGMAATASNGELWVTDADGGKVAFYSATSDTKLGEVATGSGAHGIAFSSDGNTGYVSNQTADTVSVIDVAGHTVKNTVTVGSKPNGMTFRAKQ